MSQRQRAQFLGHSGPTSRNTSATQLVLRPRSLYSVQIAPHRGFTMFFTFVVRPGEAPEGRGPQLEPFWTFLVNYNLRLGLLIQLTAYATLLATTSSGGKDPLSLLSFFRSNPESVGTWAHAFALPSAFHLTVPRLGLPMCACPCLTAYISEAQTQCRCISAAMEAILMHRYSGTKAAIGALLPRSVS